MACSSSSLQAERLQQAQGTQADCANGWLGDLGGTQLCLLLLGCPRFKAISRVDQVVQAGCCRFSLFEAVQQLGEGTGQVAEHTHILGSLAGKQQAR